MRLNRVDDLQKLEEAGDKKDDGDPGLRNWIIDSSTIRIHRRAAGPFRDGEPREIRHSLGGRTTKIHAVVNGKAGLRRMRLSPGQAADRAEAAAFLDGLEAGCVLIADKAYDAVAVLKRTAEVSCPAVIPSEPNRRRQRPLDAAAYAKRNVIKRFFGRITEFRQAATRFNKRTHNFAAVILTGISRLLRYDAKRTAGYAAWLSGLGPSPAAAVMTDTIPLRARVDCVDRRTATGTALSAVDTRLPPLGAGNFPGGGGGNRPPMSTSAMPPIVLIAILVPAFCVFVASG